MAKIKQLYDIESFKRFSDSLQPFTSKGFNDAAPGVVLSRQLTIVDPTIFEKKFPELTLLNSGIEIDNSGGYAEKIQSLRVRPQGAFKNAKDESTDGGKISLAGEDSDIRVIHRKGYSLWTTTDIEQANMAGINLVSQFLGAHNKLYQQDIDTAGYIGIPGFTGSTGLLNHAGFTSIAATGAASALTGKALYEQIERLILAQWNAVNNVPEYKANRVVMPVRVMNYCLRVYDPTGVSTDSVLVALRKNYPTVEFIQTHLAESVSGTSRTVAFSTNGEVMKHRIPVPLNVGSIIQVGSFDYKVDSMYRIGGLDILENAGGYIMTGL